MKRVITKISCPITKRESMKVFSKNIASIEPWKNITQQSYAPNTLISFNNDWNHFINFCLEHQLTPLPATPKVIKLYLNHVRKTRKLASIKRYCITISLVHRCHGYATPVDHQEIKLLLMSIHNDKTNDFKQPAPFRKFHLDQLIEKLGNSERLKDLRDLAIWSLMFEAMLKRTELKLITLNNLDLQNPKSITLTIDNFMFTLSEETSLLISKWLNHSLITEGFLFRSINKHGHIHNQPMDPSSIYRVFRRIAVELKLSHSVIFSGQSPRIGASLDLSEDGYQINEIQSKGRWKSSAMPAQYVGQIAKRNVEMDKFKKKKEWK